MISSPGLAAARPSFIRADFSGVDGKDLSLGGLFARVYDLRAVNAQADPGAFAFEKLGNSARARTDHLPGARVAVI
jgi:hypothetical protein